MGSQAYNIISPVFAHINFVMNIHLPALARGPLSEFRRVERNALTAEHGDIYQLKDNAVISSLEVILKCGENRDEQKNLCHFLFGNNRRRWTEFYFIVDRCRPTPIVQWTIYISRSILTIVLCDNSVNDLISSWDLLLTTIEHDWKSGAM